MPTDEGEPITEERLRDALDRHGSVYGVAKEWDCARSNVYYHMVKHDVANPRTGDVPTMGKDN